MGASDSKKPHASTEETWSQMGLGVLAAELEVRG